MVFGRVGDAACGALADHQHFAKPQRKAAAGGGDSADGARKKKTNPEKGKAPHVCLCVCVHAKRLR